jgi:hypothetical protein
MPGEKCREHLPCPREKQNLMQGNIKGMVEMGKAGIAQAQGHRATVVTYNVDVPPT